MNEFRCVCPKYLVSYSVPVFFDMISVGQVATGNYFAERVRASSWVFLFQQR